jgi:hypothetical protein
MHATKTQFEQVPVKLVERIAKVFPERESENIRENYSEELADDIVNVEGFKSPSAKSRLRMDAGATCSGKSEFPA